MTDKDKSKNQDDDFIVHENEIIDNKNEDLKALDRNLIHSANKRGLNKKVKAFLALVSFALVAILMLIIGLSQAFKKSDAKAVTPTKEETEPYNRDNSGTYLNNLKNDIARSITEIKDREMDKEKKAAQEKEETQEPPVILPVQNNVSSSFDNNNSGDKPLTPEQRRLQGSVLVDFHENTRNESQINDEGDDSDFLQGATFNNGSVKKVKNRQYLLSAATSISCVLKTKIVTSYPSVTLCQITKDIYSDDGKTVLIRKGAQLQGEQTKVMQQGIARVFVNWTTVKDENINVRIDALGADSLGASGLPAWVDSHFWDRFKGAILLSFIQDAISAGTSQLAKQNNSTVNMSNTENSTKEIAKMALENSINIAPTAYVNQGEMLTVIVPRNIDFSSIFEVR